jgi:DNA-binding beta-propeller fold protein YncE
VRGHGAALAGAHYRVALPVAEALALLDYAGALAGVVVMANGAGAGLKPAPAALSSSPAPAGAREHAEDQKYRFEPIVGARVPHRDGMYHAVMGRGVLNGPGLGANFCDTDEMDVDDAGDVFWTESGTFNILRRWDARTAMVTTAAGSACGDLDGPLGRARFAGWGGGGYGPSSIVVSPDGRHVFIKDVGNGGRLRHVDFEAGLVSTLGNYIPARDPRGDVYVLDPKGTEVPPGRGYRPLKAAALDWQRGLGWGSWWVLDAAHEKLYTHSRSAVGWFDLRTGKLGGYLTWPDWSKPGARETDTSGPLETTNFQCPIGIAISPGGRFLYVGGGDSTSFWRLDLQKKRVLIFSRDAGGICSFQEGKENTPATKFSAWPSVAKFSPDGTAAWSAPSGIYRLVPMK